VTRRPELSVVVPVYDEEGNVEPLHAELTDVCTRLGRPYEIVFVNDGSRDGTLARLSALVGTDPHLRVVDLDGNFGEAAALCAGFSVARGDVVVTLDGDGQNDPHDIPRLLDALRPDVDVVSGRRLQREGSMTTRVIPSWVANRMIVLATRVPVYDCGCGLKAYRRDVLTDAQLPKGMNRFMPAILGVPGTRVAEVTTRDRRRGSGQSHYGLWRVAVVFRDLPSLPLLCRHEKPARGVARALRVGALVLATAGVLAVGRWHPGWSLVAIAGAAIASAVRHNVERFVEAQEHGVFRIRRMLTHGDFAAEDRDRGRGILGQEPAPDLRRARNGARHLPV
jgi:hypothetical protein